MRGRHLDIRHLDSGDRWSRVAVVVAKYGRTAVARNTLKRRLRELVRTRLLPRVSGLDVLVRATREAYSAGFDALRDEIDSAVARLGAPDQ